MDEPFDIKELRERVNWSQDRLAEFLGVDRSSVSHMENGRAPRGPVKRLLAMLAAAADSDTVDLLYPAETASTVDVRKSPTAAEAAA